MHKLQMSDGLHEIEVDMAEELDEEQALDAMIDFASQLHGGMSFFLALEGGEMWRMNAGENAAEQVMPFEEA